MPFPVPKGRDASESGACCHRVASVPAPAGTSLGLRRCARMGAGFCKPALAKARVCAVTVPAVHRGGKTPGTLCLVKFVCVEVIYMKNPFSGLKKREWCLWIASVLVVAASNFLTGETNPVLLTATLIGVTALIFVARGDVWGQILTVVFSVLYAAASYTFRYYGEMITYLGMTAPIAVLSIVTWLRHPVEKGKNEVKIHRLSPWETALMFTLTVAVTGIFYFVLKAFDTPNLAVSTVSIATSFLASYLMLYRNSYYALAYAANDVVLMILWVLASMQDITYLPMIVCFGMFLINDFYGFLSWKLREREQHALLQKGEEAA